MEIVNPNGLSERQKQKIDNPYAHNTQRDVNYENAARKFREFCDSEDNPIWKVAACLDKVSK